MHRYQRANRLLLHGFGSHVKRIEHGALAIGQVGTRGSYLADLFKDFLHQLEVVRHKGVVGDKALDAFDIFQRGAGAVKGQLVTQNGAFGLKHAFQLRACRVGFHQQALADHFVGVGA